MSKKNVNLRGVVLTWTILTTTFFWTSTMRILLKPQISDWSIFTIGGKGFLGDFWLPPLIVLIALFIFYLEGRGKIRTLYHFLLLGWHVLITAVIVYGSLQTNAKITFGTWGISLSFIWLVVPFALFLVLAVKLVTEEIKQNKLVPEYKWKAVNWKLLGIAALLLPVAIIFFQLGTGFNWLVKIAVASTIFQWIFMAEALGRPDSKKLKPTTNN